MRRIAVLLLGCLAASLAAGLVGAAILVSLIRLRDGEFPGDWLSAILVFAVILASYAAIASLTLGLAAHALLNSLNRTGWSAYGLSGLIAGGCVGMLFGGPAEFAIFGAGLGAGVVGALAFRATVRPSAGSTSAVAAKA